jgi:Skp family chaperone for outer membrane proteins
MGRHADRAVRNIALVALLLTSAPAWALKLCSIDFQTAVNDTAEGKAAQTKIDGMYSTRKAELERMQTELEKAVQDYQSRQLILSADAKGQEEQKLALQQRTFEQTYMQYQNEMQQTYMGLLGDLDEKMRAIAQAVGKEQGCTAVIDKAAIVYGGPDLADVTQILVTKYNAQHPSK